MKKCIVFDIDRTIVDSYLPELLSLQEAIEKVTHKNISEEEMKKITSLPTSDFFKYLNLSDNEIKLVNKEWKVTFNKYKTKCFPGIKELINDLFNKDFILCVITSRTMEEFHELDEELSDTLKQFKIIVTSNIVNNPKPDIESMTYIFNELKLSKEDVIYIGDSNIDKVFSQNSGVCFIPACWENKELENEENACFSINDLMRMINEINMY